MINESTAKKVCMAMLATTGGSSIVAQSIGQSLTSSDKNFDVRFCHLRPDQLKPNHFLLNSQIGSNNSELLDISPSFGSNMDCTSELLRVHEKWPFELLHIHNLQVFGLPAILLKQLRNIPYVVTCHGSDILNSQLFDQNLEVATHILKNADAITCVSQHLADMLRHKVSGLNKVEVINNFISPSWQKTNLEQQTIRQVNKQKFLHVSSMRTVKRPQILFKAFAKLQTTSPQAQLSIVTTSEGVKRVDRMLNDGLHNGEGIKLINGDESQHALADEYASSQAMILTSQFEGFGLVVLEALQHNLPVIAPSVGALPEVLGCDWPYLIDEQNDKQLITKLAQAMQDVVFSNQSKLQQRIKQITQRYNGSKQISQYTQLYLHILQQFRT